MAGRENIEASADLRQMAAFFYQMFAALTNEGFSEHQALTIIGFAMQTGASGGE